MGAREHRSGCGAAAGRRAMPEILIVEDDADFVADLLAVWHPPRPVAVARSGREAHEYLRAFLPAAVLLDLTLPHYLAEADWNEGLEILSYIRSSVSAQLPVIVVSSNGSEETRRRAAELGADGFIAKPVVIGDLEQALKRLGLD